MASGSPPVQLQAGTPFRFFWVLAAACVAATACGSAGASDIDVEWSATPHVSSTDCGIGFVAHDLEHVTSGPGNTASTFDGTGAGVGVGDLDGDGDLDIVLANLSETSSILENRGGLDFVRHELEPGRFRGVAILDLTGDLANDIILTTGIGPPVLFANPANDNLDRFERVRLEGIRAATYSMAWTDLGGDGDLDVITGSYNAELSLLRNTPVLGEDTGVVLHERTSNGYVTERLSDTAQTLALITTDTDGDRQADIVVGNDLATPDMVWRATDDGLEASSPFVTSSYSTMSYDSADIDNDGNLELFSTDMKPASPDDRYREVEADLAAAPVVDNIQIPENVLVTTGDDSWTNMASGEPISTTGWSWSGLFGDLDNDGQQDLYVVNGMRSEGLFGFLPDARLIEENQAFRNVDGSLTPTPEWGLAAADGGRGMAFADMDADGDLDIIINNLDAPSRLYENQLCGNSVTVSLGWTGTENVDALGSTVVATSPTSTWTREITSSRGYLSSGPPVAHIGLGDESTVDIKVTWPDGAVSSILAVSASTHITITR